MPAVDTEAQFKFLLCCIKHSASGKVNFDNVSQELGIVTKAAAAKRYERLLKAHDINITTPRKGAGARGNIGDNSAEDSGEPKTPASKKRKRGAAAVNKQDDDEEETPVKKERVTKKEEQPSDDEKTKGESGDSDYISE